MEPHGAHVATVYKENVEPRLTQAKGSRGARGVIPR